MLRIFVTILLLVVLVLGASLAYFNAGNVRFSYLAGEIELPLIALLVLDFLLGVLLTFLVVSGRVLGLRVEIRRLRKQVRDVEVELKSLRALPLPSDTPR